MFVSQLKNRVIWVNLTEGHQQYVIIW